MLDALKLFKQFKLGNSLFTGNFRVDILDIKRGNLPESEIEKRVIRRMVDDLSNLIISKNQSSITKEEKNEYIEYRCQLLVLKLEDFKTIVEAAIQMMPDSEIDKIKNSELI